MKNGAIYALMALTVVIIYKTTGHLNFAQGEMGTLGAFIVFVLVIEHGWSYWLAIPVALVFSFVLGRGARAHADPADRTAQRPRRRDRDPRHLPGHQRAQRRDLGDAAAHSARAVPEPPRRSVRASRRVRPGSPSATAAIGTWVDVGHRRCGPAGSSSRRRSSAWAIAPSPRTVSRASSSACRSGRMLMLGWAISAVLGTIAAIMVSQSASTLDFNLMASGPALRLRGGGARWVRQHPGGRGRRADRRHGRGVHPVVLQLRRVRAEPGCRARGHRRRACSCGQRACSAPRGWSAYELADRHRQGLAQAPALAGRRLRHRRWRHLLDRLSGSRTTRS